MRHIFIILIFFLIPFVGLRAQTKREVRAVWLTTAYGLDWPSTRAVTPLGVKKQKAELCRILDELQKANFNTILFQARIRGDVIYPSAIESYNEILTGRSGKSPGYDPLAFAVDECHKRGMELHAWIVSIPLGTAKHVRSLGAGSVTRKQPSICKQYQGEWFLDPGHPGTKEYLNRIVKEVVANYDVDGVHLDYIRYPDHPAAFPDKDTYRKYGKGLSLAVWRRENVTGIVRHIYQTVKSVKPWVKVSSSPIGKFRDTSRYSSRGWNGYHAVYQDAQGWLREGIQDMLFPMMYFSGNQFYPFALDWQEQCNGRQIVPGLGVYFLHPSEKNWPLDEIERQISFTRREGLAGQAYYRAKFIMDNTKGILDELVCKYYPYPALTPAMTWLDSIAPGAPSQPTLREQYGEVSLNWSVSIDNDARRTPAYTVYASDTYPVDVNCAANLIVTGLRENHYTYSYVYPDKRKRFFAVTAIDRYGNESEPLQFNSPGKPAVSHCDGKVLYLPPLPDARFVTVTDISGRCVLHVPYSQNVLLEEKLSQGTYRILITNDREIIRDYIVLLQSIYAR